MDYPSTYNNASPHLCRNSPQHSSIPSPEPQSDLRTFTPAYLPGHGMTINRPVWNMEPFIPPFPSSSLHYSPIFTPLTEGLEFSQFIEPFEYAGDRLYPDLGMPLLYGPYAPPLPFQVNLSTSGFVPQGFHNALGTVGFGFGGSQVMGRDCTAPRLFDPSSVTGTSSFTDPLQLHAPVALPFIDPLKLYTQTVLSSNDAPGFHLPTVSASSETPFLDATPSSDNPLLDTVPSSDNDSLGIAYSVDPRSLNISPPSGNPLLDITSSGDNAFLGIVCPDDPYPLDISPSGDLSFHLPATPSSSSNSSSPLGVFPPYDPPDLRPCNASPAHSNSSATTRVTDNPDLSNDSDLSSNPTFDPVQTAQENLQDVDMQDPDTILLYAKQNEGGMHECTWSDGGDRVCGYRGQLTQVRRHVARVHFELRYVPNHSTGSATDAR
jgi:hypothetical protein